MCRQAFEHITYQALDNVDTIEEPGLDIQHDEKFFHLHLHCPLVCFVSCKLHVIHVLNTWMPNYPVLSIGSFFTHNTRTKF